MSEIPSSPAPDPSAPVAPSAAVAPREYKGVRGWLLLFCIGLTILAPIRSLSDAVSSYKEFSPYFSNVPNLQSFWITLTSLNVALAIYACIAGIGLWTVRAGAVKQAKRFLWSLLAFSVGAMFLPILFGVPVASVAYVKPAGILTFFIWYFYLKKSKRVKATYGPGDIA